MIAAARRISYRILLQIATSDAHSDELLRGAEVDALSAQDRNLATMLVLGTLRWQLSLDARIQALLTKPRARLSAEAATALRMGAYQLLYLERIPAHAAIHDSVELVKSGKERGAARLVNAVLRGVQRTASGGQDCGNPAPSEERLGAEELAKRWSHPAWMVERWVRRYGAEAAEAICRADQEAPGTAVRAEPDAAFGDLETEPGAFLSCARRVLRGDAGRNPAVRAGRARIQEEASQLVAEMLAAGDWPSRRTRFAPGGRQRVLDTCAAPGGKTAVLAERLPGAEITAVDASRKRVDGMRRMPALASERIRLQVADAAKLELRPEWDRILCDVPCSGTGTLARNPEIKLRLEEADLARQQARQKAILRTGLSGLAQGGRLVYSSCSLEPEENEDVVAAVLREVAGFRVVPAAGVLDELAASGVLTAEGRERLRGATQGEYLRTVPGEDPCDGFFAAVLERI